MNKIPADAKSLTFLNAAIITAHGTFEFQKLLLKEAREIVAGFNEANRKIQSAIGHAATAELMTMLLKFPVPQNRIDFVQTTEAAALVFKLKKRAPEGVVLTREELEEIGYELGLLTRTA
jgi:phage host-nuclease inhibitor protein Gam